MSRSFLCNPESVRVVEYLSPYNIRVLLDDRRWYPPDYSGGAALCGLSLAERAVYADRTAGPEDVLHEMSHIVCQCPDGGLDDFCESWVLLGFEMAVAKELWEPGTQEFKDVTAYQYVTQIRHPMDRRRVVPMPDIPYELVDQMLGQAMGRCRTLGLLDADDRPTLKEANWAGWKGRRASGKKYRVV